MIILNNFFWSTNLRTEDSEYFLILLLYWLIMIVDRSIDGHILNWKEIIKNWLIVIIAFSIFFIGDYFIIIFPLKNIPIVDCCLSHCIEIHVLINIVGNRKISKVLIDVNVFIINFMLIIIALLIVNISHHGINIVSVYFIIISDMWELNSFRIRFDFSI